MAFIRLRNDTRTNLKRREEKIEDTFYDKDIFQMPGTDAWNSIKEGLNLVFIKPQDFSDAELSVSSFASKDRKGHCEKEGKNQKNSKLC